eukprot:m.107728 g.107728  ORF g.107728 m.107728 type:complete len:332 (+) comp16929_c0_seq22:280-1275(+)
MSDIMRPSLQKIVIAFIFVVVVVVFWRSGPPHAATSYAREGPVPEQQLDSIIRRVNLSLVPDNIDHSAQGTVLRNFIQDSQNGKLEHLLAVVYNILGTTDPEAGDTGAAGVDVVLARATLQSCYWQRRLQDRKTFPHRGHLTVFATPDALVPSMFHRALLNKSGVGMETRRPGLVTMFRKLASTGLRDPVIVEVNVVRRGRDASTLQLPTGRAPRTLKGQADPLYPPVPVSWVYPLRQLHCHGRVWTAPHLARSVVQWEFGDPGWCFDMKQGQRPCISRVLAGDSDAIPLVGVSCFPFLEHHHRVSGCRTPTITGVGSMCGTDMWIPPVVA